MNASQATSPTAQQRAQQTAGTVKEIQAGAATIRILGEHLFEVNDSPRWEAEPFFTYGPYFLEDLQEHIDEIVAVVSKPNWWEDDLNAAIERANDAEINRTTIGGPLRHIHSED